MLPSLPLNVKIMRKDFIVFYQSQNYTRLFVNKTQMY